MLDISQSDDAQVQAVQRCSWPNRDQEEPCGLRDYQSGGQAARDAASSKASALDKLKSWLYHISAGPQILVMTAVVLLVISYWTWFWTGDAKWTRPGADGVDDFSATYQLLIDPVISVATLVVACAIGVANSITTWRGSLAKRATAVFHLDQNGSDRVLMVCQEAYLTDRGDLRQWGQQIGRQMNNGQLLTFDPFITEDRPELRVEKQDSGSGGSRQHWWLRLSIVTAFAGAAYFSLPGYKVLACLALAIALVVVLLWSARKPRVFQLFRIHFYLTNGPGEEGPGKEVFWWDKDLTTFSGTMKCSTCPFWPIGSHADNPDAIPATSPDSPTPPDSASAQETSEETPPGTTPDPPTPPDSTEQ